MPSGIYERKSEGPYEKMLKKKYKGVKFMKKPKLKASGGLISGMRRFNRGGKV
jgi:hypothetical protein